MCNRLVMNQIMKRKDIILYMTFITSSLYEIMDSNINQKRNYKGYKIGAQLLAPTPQLET